MEIISQLGLDSGLGILSFILTVASLALPILISRNRKQKKARSKSAEFSDFIVAGNVKKWVDTPAKITKYAFATGPITVSKIMMKKILKKGRSPLVAFVEFEDNSGNKLQAEVFTGERDFHEGEIIHVKYSLINKKQVILV